jgi:hypothetical protein
MAYYLHVWKEKNELGLNATVNEQSGAIFKDDIDPLKVTVLHTSKIKLDRGSPEALKGLQAIAGDEEINHLWFAMHEIAGHAFIAGARLGEKRRRELLKLVDAK